MSATIAILGAGPRGVGVLERIAATLGGAEVPLTIHLVDPHPIGAGRIWRADQSPLLKLNSMAEDVTMFTDESATIEGPISPGPSLIEWAEQIRDGRITDVTVNDPLVASELHALAATSFPTRRLHSYYLHWFYRRALAALAATVTVVEHESTAVSVDDDQRVTLATGETIEADIVIYALGHIGVEPDSESRALAEFAATHGATYVPPSFTADADLSVIGAGEHVIVRGMGLAAVDLVVLLTEGRGGRFVDGDYLPSGREPKLYLGSRRGVPYHAKITSTLAAPRVEARFFTAAVAAELERSTDQLAFIEHVWPLIAKELLWGYYHELAVGHPDRVRASWPEFADIIESEPWNGPLLHAFVDSVVPDSRDRLDLEKLDRPLAGELFENPDQLQQRVREYIEIDLHLRSAPEHSATLALFYSLLFSLFDLGTIIDSPKWTARSRAHELPRWWLNYFSHIASGPPGHRLEELLALSRAGVVEFIGPDIEVLTDATAFVARSASVERSITARVLVDARLPDTDVATTTNPLLRSLLASAAEELVSDHTHVGTTGRLRVDAASRVIRADGTPHPARFAIGAFTSAPFVGAFARPRTNAVSFRENDRVARAVLDLVVLASAR